MDQFDYDALKRVFSEGSCPDEVLTWPSDFWGAGEAFKREASIEPICLHQFFSGIADCMPEKLIWSSDQGGVTTVEETLCASFNTRPMLSPI
jgi:hypothetical protein